MKKEDRLDCELFSMLPFSFQGPVSKKGPVSKEFRATPLKRKLRSRDEVGFHPQAPCVTLSSVALACFCQSSFYSIQINVFMTGKILVL